MQYNRILLKLSGESLMGEQNMVLTLGVWKAMPVKFMKSQRWESRSESSSEVEIFLED